MDAKTEILTRIRNAHQLSNMPTDVEIVRTYNTNKTEEYSREQLKEILIERLEDYKAIVHETSVKKLPQTIADVLKERGAKEIRYAEGLDKKLFSAFTGKATPDDRSTDPRLLNDVDAVVTDSHVSSAQTGTICHKPSLTCSRSAARRRFATPRGWTRNCFRPSPARPPRMIAAPTRDCSTMLMRWSPIRTCRRPRRVRSAWSRILCVGVAH